MVKIMSMEHEYGLAHKSEKDHRHLAYQIYNSADKFTIIERNHPSIIPRKHLKNGAQIYVDCGHIEIALPECSNPKEVVLYDQATSSILKQIADKTDILIFKNNLDSKGTSFGCHENYHLELELLRENMKIPLPYNLPYSYSLLISKISPILVPFLITRQIIAGSGHISKNKYLLSQRSTVIKTPSSLNTRESRPIINEKNEPFSKKGIRLHLISGDSNMSEFTNYLKISTTALVLTMIENGINFPEISIENPIKTLNEINSKNINSKIKGLKRIPKKTFFGNFLTLPETTYCSPLDVQKIYLEKALDFTANKSFIPTWAEESVNNWQFVLNSLEKNPFSLNGHIDWVIKKFLIKEYIKSKRKKLNDEEVQKIALYYHLISNKIGFGAYSNLLGLETIITEEEIEKAIHNPPNNTRAYGRTKILEDLVKQKAENIDFSWNCISHKRDIIHLPEPDDSYASLL